MTRGTQPLQAVNTNGVNVWGPMPPSLSFPYTPSAPRSPLPASLRCSDPRHTSFFFSSVSLSLLHSTRLSAGPNSQKENRHSSAFPIGSSEVLQNKRPDSLVKSSHPERTNFGPLPGVFYPHTPSGPWHSIHSPFQAFFSCSSKVRLFNAKKKKRNIQCINLRDDVQSSGQYFKNKHNQDSNLVQTM